jgi:3-oxoacyl-[acyl-carrier-protein] synthase-3
MGGNLPPQLAERTAECAGDPPFTEWRDMVNASVVRSSIVALGHYQPARVLHNVELSDRMDTSDAWIRQRVGIVTRRLAGADETVTAMATNACTKALAHCGLDPDDIDLVVVATATALDRMPNIASRVARQLGVGQAAVFDVNAACSGFTYALTTADHAIRAGATHTAIVVGVDKMSDFLDWTDRSTCILFGDGAGAAILTTADSVSGVGIGPVAWGSAPDQGDAITLGTAGPDGPRPLFQQNGQAVYRWATTTLAAVARRACELAGVEPSALAGVVTHQANGRIVDAIVRKIGAPNAVVARDLVESGNTSAASVPLALSKLVERGELTSGDVVLLLGFGAGLTYAGQVVNCP